MNQKAPDYAFSSGYLKVKTLDMHTGGEPLRIILEGFPLLDGQSVLEARRAMKEKYDHLRKSVMWEPRGHKDMYGALIFSPGHSDCDFGIIFMHNEGYSTMCGHGTIAVARALYELGWVPPANPVTTIKLDVPCGQVKASVFLEDGKVNRISFDNVPSFYLGRYELSVESLGMIDFDLAYGGAFYAYVEASDFGLEINPANVGAFVRIAEKIKREINESGIPVNHPVEPELGFLYGIIFTGAARDPEHHSRNICVFADGEVDRSPTGSGISGRAAMLFDKGLMEVGQDIIIESFLGTTMSVSVRETVQYGPHKAVIPTVSGMAYYCGLNEFWIDPADPLKDGFLVK